LPDSVDADQAEPKYENGVLTVTFPKIEAKKAKRLEIKTG
jgi:HSP20 family molecular chaperone IbpA